MLLQLVSWLNLHMLLLKLLVASLLVGCSGSCLLKLSAATLSFQSPVLRTYAKSLQDRDSVAAILILACSRQVGLWRLSSNLLAEVFKLRTPFRLSIDRLVGSSRLLSIGLQSVLFRFDGELLDNILLSPVKLKKNLRLNNKPRIAPFPWRQPKGSPVYQAVCASSIEAHGRGRHGIAAVPCRSRSLLLFGLSWRMFFLVQLALPSKWVMLFSMSYLLLPCTGMPFSLNSICNPHYINKFMSS